MPATRPASFTTFAILNIIFGALFVLCGLAGLGDTKIEANGKDLTQPFKDYMESEVPAYKVYKIGSVVITEALAIGYIVAGIGLLQVTAWGRLLALICAGAATLFEIFNAIYQLTLVNPAISKFLAAGSVQLGGLFSSMASFGTITGAVLAIVYNAVLIALLMGEKAARAVRGGYVPDEDDEDRPRRRRPVRYEDEDEEEDRPRKRARRDEDEDEPPPRRPRREDNIQEDPPRRKPSRPRPPDEDDE